MTLREYAEAGWRRTGVSEVCLRLQDRHGQSVALLLWRAWATAEGRRVHSGTVGGAMATARAWETEIIAPLRLARRNLDKTFDGLAIAAVESLRQAVRAGELEAERALLDALEAMTPPPSDIEGRLADNLVDLMQIWNGGEARAEVRDLAASLG